MDPRHGFPVATKVGEFHSITTTLYYLHAIHRNRISVANYGRWLVGWYPSNENSLDKRTWCSLTYNGVFLDFI